MIPTILWWLVTFSPNCFLSPFHQTVSSVLINKTCWNTNLSHWGWDQIATISLRLFLTPFSCIKTVVFWFKFHQISCPESSQQWATLLALCEGNPPVTPHKGQWRGALMLSLICAWTNGWANNPDAGNLRCHRTHYDVTVMDEDSLAG